MEIPKSFLGYKRENGRAGTRNHVIILPVDDISNACAEAVANNIKGTIATASAQAFEISSTGRIITWFLVPALPFSLL